MVQAPFTSQQAPTHGLGEQTLPVGIWPPAQVPTMNTQPPALGSQQAVVVCGQVPPVPLQVEPKPRKRLGEAQPGGRTTEQVPLVAQQAPWQGVGVQTPSWREPLAQVA